jgi:hypothetical protein
MISGRLRSVVPIQGGLVLKKDRYPELRSLNVEHIHDCERFGESVRYETSRALDA